MSRRIVYKWIISVKEVIYNSYYNRIIFFIPFTILSVFCIINCPRCLFFIHAFSNNLITGTEFKHLPPCWSVLENKIKRANYLAKLIKNCTEHIYNFDDPGTQGWTINSKNQYEVEFFSGAQYPQLIENEAPNLIASVSADEDSDIQLSSDDESEYEASSDEADNQSTDDEYTDNDHIIFE